MWTDFGGTRLACPNVVSSVHMGMPVWFLGSQTEQECPRLAKVQFLGTLVWFYLFERPELPNESAHEGLNLDPPAQNNCRSTTNQRCAAAVTFLKD